MATGAAGQLSVRVSLLYFDGCPSWREAERRLQAVLGPEDELTYVHVRTPEEAERLAFRGSPTVLVDGQDPFADEDDPVGLSCRLFRTPDGLQGAPTEEQLREALGRG